jgi:hypothetical protein
MRLLSFQFCSIFQNIVAISLDRGNALADLNAVYFVPEFSLVCYLNCFFHNCPRLINEFPYCMYIFPSLWFMHLFSE